MRVFGKIEPLGFRVVMVPVQCRCVLAVPANFTTRREGNSVNYTSYKNTVVSATENGNCFLLHFPCRTGRYSFFSGTKIVPLSVLRLAALLLVVPFAVGRPTAFDGRVPAGGFSLQGVSSPV